MSTRATLLAVLAVFLANTACQQPAQEAPGLSEEDVAAIRDVIGSYQDAMLAGDWDAAVTLFAADAVRMPPNAPAIQGREAIRMEFEAAPVVYTNFTNAAVEIDGRDGLAYARGTYSMTLAVEGMPESVTDTGKYLAIFRKQPDGSWLAAIDTWNSDLLPPEQSAEAGT